MKNTEKELTLEQKAYLTAEEIEKKISSEAESGVAEVDIADGETPLDQNVRLMSPLRMVLRRFFHSKLSIVGLVLIAALFIFSWFGPVICNWAGYWEETETNTKLKHVMDRSFEEVCAMVGEKKVTLREAAYMIAIQRVVEAKKIRGVWP